MELTSNLSLPDTNGNTDASGAMYDEKLLGNSGTAWNDWGTPSGTCAYPESKTERDKQFSLVMNPSLSDGRELMGFGGDLGKKRLHSRDHHDGVASSSTTDLPWSEGTGANSQVPYIIGFEKQVLAL